MRKPTKYSIIWSTKNHRRGRGVFEQYTKQPDSVSETNAVATPGTTQQLGLEITTVPFAQIAQFSDRDRAYATGDARLRPFYKYPVAWESFAEVARDKRRDKTDRKTLVRVLREQYAKLDSSEATQRNIASLLDEDTFTVVTAHQPSLFTGPLYYVYKIISVLNLAEELNRRNDDFRTVPVFITGGEDHDFEEINHLHLFGNTIEWNNDVDGSVGRMPTDTLHDALAQLKDILGKGEHAQRIYERIERVHTECKTYGAAAVALANELFGKYGLVVVNMDQPELKRTFIPHIEREIFEQTSQPLVEATIEQLNEAGFSKQAHPREINFFYLRPGERNRIVLEDGTYRVLDTDLRFTEAELRAEIQAYPERFSPNVVMRPIYQECVLPNLAYVGGGGEIAYWLERKSQFEAFGLNFPLLLRRNSATWIDKTASKRMQKLGLSFGELMNEEESVVKDWLRRNTDAELNLKAEKKELHQLFERIGEKMRSVDATLGKAAKAEATNQLKALSQLEGRLMRAEKQKHETSVGQIRSVREKLFPGNGMQERHDNFLSFYVRYGEDYFETLRENFDPLKAELVVIEDRK